MKKIFQYKFVKSSKVEFIYRTTGKPLCPSIVWCDARNGTLGTCYYILRVIRSIKLRFINPNFYLFLEIFSLIKVGTSIRTDSSYR